MKGCMAMSKTQSRHYAGQYRRQQDIIRKTKEDLREAYERVKELEAKYRCDVELVEKPMAEAPRDGSIVHVGIDGAWVPANYCTRSGEWIITFGPGQIMDFGDINKFRFRGPVIPPDNAED